MISGIDVAETRHIHYAIGGHYGFRVDYHDFGRVMKLREELVLPGPAHWRSTSPLEQGMRSSDDGRMLKREVTLGSHTQAPPEIHSLYIEDVQIASGDPKGEYSLYLWLDGKRLRSFRFRVE